MPAEGLMQRVVRAAAGGAARQLNFSPDEYRSRIRATQECMKDQGLDLMLLHSPENIYYLTGYETSGYFAYQVLAMPAAGVPLLLVRLMERGLVEVHSWLGEWFVWRDGDDVIDATQRLITLLGDAHSSPIGVEKTCWFLTVDRYERLQKALKPRKVVDASGIVDRVRLIKSDDEIKYIQQAAAMAEAGVRAAVDVAGDGVSELEVAAAVHRAEIQAGCEYTGLPHYISSG